MKEFILQESMLETQGGMIVTLQKDFWNWLISHGYNYRVDWSTHPPKIMIDIKDEEMLLFLLRWG